MRGSPWEREGALKGETRELVRVILILHKLEKGDKKGKTLDIDRQISEGSKMIRLPSRRRLREKQAQHSRRKGKKIERGAASKG